MRLEFTCLGYFLSVELVVLLVARTRGATTAASIRIEKMFTDRNIVLFVHINKKHFL